jgi:hypothetical protein
MPRAHRAGTRGVYAIEDPALLLPDPLALDTSFVVEALIESQPLPGRIVHSRGRPTNVASVASVARRLVDHAITSAVREDVVAATNGPGDQPAV